MSELEPQSHGELEEVGRYALRTQAQERGLVVLAMGLGYWLFPSAGEFVLCVRASDAAGVREELRRFEQETAARDAAHDQTRPSPLPEHKSHSLFVFLWFLTACFIFQGLAPEGWVERGVAGNVQILKGEWWRCVTALTLHSDLNHLLANAAAGLLFAAFLVPILGGGLTWSLVLLSGILGNAINAWGYRGETHSAIGASTAVFGALGVLTGLRIATSILERKAPSVRDVMIPLGGGLALLSVLGTGTGNALEKIDYMSHLWGFVSGIPLGTIAGFGRVGERTSIRLQYFLGGCALFIPALSWMLALHSIFFPA